MTGGLYLTWPQLWGFLGLCITVCAAGILTFEILSRSDHQETPTQAILCPACTSQPPPPPPARVISWGDLEAAIAIVEPQYTRTLDFEEQTAELTRRTETEIHHLTQRAEQRFGRLQ